MWRVCLFAFLYLVRVDADDWSFPSKYDAIDGLECLLRYMSRTRKDLNLDGVFGVRMGEGELKSLLTSTEHRFSPELTNRIRDLLGVAESISSDAVPLLAKSAGDYFKNFRPVLKEAWQFQKFRYQIRKLDDRQIEFAKKTKIKEDEMFDEEKSDLCMTGLLGTGKWKEPCSTTDDCLKSMVLEDTNGYHVTHQLLYLSLARRMGCEGVFQRRLEKFEKSWSDLEMEKCSRVYVEMVKAEESGKLEKDVSFRDLFLESIAICGPLGFFQVLRPKWLGMVLAWQNESGCFNLGIPDYEDDYSEAEVREIDKHERQRKLLVDRILSDGCSSHASGLGAGFFAAYVHLYSLRPELLVESGRTFVPAENVAQIRSKLRRCSSNSAALDNPGKDTPYFISLIFVIVVLIGLWRWGKLRRRVLSFTAKLAQTRIV